MNDLEFDEDDFESFAMELTDLLKKYDAEIGVEMDGDICEFVVQKVGRLRGIPLVLGYRQYLCAADLEE